MRNSGSWWKRILSRMASLTERRTLNRNRFNRRTLVCEQLEDRCLLASGLDPSMIGVIIAVQQSTALGDVLVTNAPEIMVNPPLLGIAQGLLRQDALHLNQSTEIIQWGEQQAPSDDHLQTFFWQFLDKAVQFSEFRDSLLGLIFHVDLTAGLQDQTPTQPPAAPLPPTPPPSPSPPGEGSPAGVLGLKGISETAFNAVNTPFQFTLSGAVFSANPADIHIFDNGVELPGSAINVNEDTITIASGLMDGRNDLQLIGVDSAGQPLVMAATAWAGSNTLTANVIDSNGQAVTDPVTLTVALGDNQRVTAQTITATGTATFQNLPDRTILLKGVANGNRLTLIGTIGSAQTVQMTLLGFNTPSPVENNDFSLDTTGWDVGIAPVQIVPHTEDAGPKGHAASPHAIAQGIPTSAVDATSLSAFAMPAAADLDNDLVLTTSGEGEQSISRTFVTKPGTTEVVLRYRFVTSEVPGGYFGTKYNDYFRVSLRSLSKGVASAESNSMNGLGLGSFDADGSTSWRTVRLKVDPKGDTIQVDVGVANVADGILDSQVIVDKITEEQANDNDLAVVDAEFTTKRGTLFGEASQLGSFLFGAGFDPNDLTAKIRVTNRGAVDSGPIQIRIYASPDGNFEHGRLLNFGILLVPEGLAAGEEREFEIASIENPIYSSEFNDGFFFIGRVTHAGANAPPESDLTNNQLAVDLCYDTDLLDSAATTLGLLASIEGLLGFQTGSNHLAHFLSGSGEAVDWDADSIAAAQAAQSPYFLALAAKVRTYIEGRITNFLQNQPLPNTTPATYTQADVMGSDPSVPDTVLKGELLLRSTVNLFLAFNGIQGREAAVQKLSVSYSIQNGRRVAQYEGTVQFILRDNYSFDAGDATWAFNAPGRYLELCGNAASFDSSVTIDSPIQGTLDLGAV